MMTNGNKQLSVKVEPAKRSRKNILKNAFQFSVVCFFFLMKYALLNDKIFNSINSRKFLMSDKNNLLDINFSEMCIWRQLSNIHVITSLKYCQTSRKRPLKMSNLGNRSKELVAYQRLDHIGSEFCLLFI